MAVCFKVTTYSHTCFMLRWTSNSTLTGVCLVLSGRSPLLPLNSHSVPVQSAALYWHISPLSPNSFSNSLGIFQTFFFVAFYGSGLNCGLHCSSPLWFKVALVCLVGVQDTYRNAQEETVDLSRVCPALGLRQLGMESRMTCSGKIFYKANQYII